MNFVLLNGKKYPLDANCTLLKLIQNGDEIEILDFVGGG